MYETSQRLSSWDVNAKPSYGNGFSSTPDSRLLPGRNGGDMVPATRYMNDPTMRTSQALKNPSSLPNPSQTSANASKTSVGQTCLNQITATRVIGLIIGLVLAGIPLAVVVTLYLQLSKSSQISTQCYFFDALNAIQLDIDTKTTTTTTTISTTVNPSSSTPSLSDDPMTTQV